MMTFVILISWGMSSIAALLSWRALAAASVTQSSNAALILELRAIRADIQRLSLSAAKRHTIFDEAWDNYNAGLIENTAPWREHATSRSMH